MTTTPTTPSGLPEALRLADWLQSCAESVEHVNAAAELRRQHAALSAAAPAATRVDQPTVIDWLDANDIEVTDVQLAGLFHAAPTAPQAGAESYPPMPVPAWAKRVIRTTADAYSETQMRAYADDTMALRARGAVPSGWRLVPVMPTDAMVSAGYDAFGVAGCYAAMIEAAPQAPASPTSEQAGAPGSWSDGVIAVAMMLEKKADYFALEHGHDDMGGLSFGSGAHAEAKMDWHSGLLELAEEVRSMITQAFPMTGDEEESDLGDWQDGSTKPTLDGTYLREFGEGTGTTEFHQGKWLRDGFFPSDIQHARWRGRSAPASGGDALAEADADLWYLQDTRSYVGNDVLWWAKDGNGYTTDISKAHVYTREQAFRLAAMRGCDRAWPKAYIDSKTRPAVDMQYIDHDAAMAIKVQKGGTK